MDPTVKSDIDDTDQCPVPGPGWTGDHSMCTALLNGDTDTEQEQMLRPGTGCQ